ncbi:MAG: HD domain-containing protein [Cellulophaga sp.]
MSNIVDKTKEYCLKIIRESNCKYLAFHNEEHTLDVLRNVRIIGEYEKISERDMEILKIAALFHDTGFSLDYGCHEESSVILVNNFLKQNNYKSDKLQTVISLILATKMPQNPMCEIEKILCDSDLFHLASDNFIVKNKLLRTEWENQINLKFEDLDWLNLNIEFLQNHKYKSNFGCIKLEKDKLKNIFLLEKEIKSKYSN